MSKKTTLYIILLIALEFYSINFISESIFIALNTIIFIYIGVLLNKKKSTPRHLKNVEQEPEPAKNFATLLKWFVFGVVLSFVPALLFHDQSFVYSYAVDCGFGYVLLYFYLHKKKFSVRTIENVVIYLSIGFQVLYWIELKFFATNPPFGTLWTEQATGLTRILIFGRHLFMLSLYILLGRINKKPHYFILLGVSMLTLIMLQTRQLLLPAALVFAFHFRTIIFKSFVPSMMLVLAIGIGAYFSSDIIDKLVNKSKAQQSSNTSVLGDREQSYAYFLDKPNTTIVTRLLGDGFPSPGTYYGDTYKSFRENTGLSPGDVGPVGYVTYYGYIWFISLIIMLYKSFTLKVPRQYKYAKYFMFTVLMTLPFGESQFVAVSSIITMAMAFYIIDVGNFELKQQKQIRNQQQQKQPAVA